MNINFNGSVDSSSSLAMSVRLAHAKKTLVENIAGTVNAAGGAAPAEPASDTTANASTPPTTAPARPLGPYTQSDLDQLNAHWGQSNSTYDLDGNGTVNVDDLLLMLTHWHGPDAPAPEGPRPGPSVDIAPGSTPIEKPTDRPPALPLDMPAPSADITTTPVSEPLQSPSYGQSDLDNLMAAWGQSNSPYDLDGNGTVNVNDMLQMLTHWTPGAPAASDAANTIVTPSPDKPLELLPPDQGAIGKPLFDKPLFSASGTTRPHRQKSEPTTPGTVIPALPATTGSLATRLSSSLIDRLMAAGFQDRPPTNLREIVDRLNLKPAEHKTLMGNLQNHYPQGLGVNLKA